MHVDVAVDRLVDATDVTTNVALFLKPIPNNTVWKAIKVLLALVMPVALKETLRNHNRQKPLHSMWICLRLMRRKLKFVAVLLEMVMLLQVVMLTLLASSPSIPAPYT
ncbi:uncharacterized protein LOC120779864 isoform X2 [Bactrocera tryoni]|uniref:uncharacterized protein LOC120779864 isoform X2 n=1 Tax=Bactrocera tryoni TaxID=59916 RepID=UPI001A95FF09|nr:uncharacterized protein LOC120779864 isoform X2 [Bactrocera tryoni]